MLLVCSEPTAKGDSKLKRILGKAHGQLTTAAGLIALILSCQASAQAVLEEITVTAQKRDVGLQDSPLSISAFSGETLEKGKIFNAGDLAQRTAGLSFTNPTPFDMEMNIRGVMNTRLDAPSASRSVGIFMDEVVVGRMGLMSMDFYDIERVEVLRGPQGVLLGKNVVGGAINVITAKPQFENEGKVTVSAGNLGSQLVNGFVTGGLSENLAARFAWQYRKNDGFAKDVLNDRDLHNLESMQARLSLLYQGDDGLSADLVFEYLSDEGNGTCAIGVGPMPWTASRALVGLTDIRDCMPEPVQYSDSPDGRNQGYDRNAFSASLKIEKDFDGFTLTSVTGYRSGEGDSQYSQTGLGPDAPGLQEAFFAALGAGDVPTAVSYGLSFDFPVREDEDLTQFSQEIRLTSNDTSSAVDWIVGAYYQKDEVDKFDRFWSEILLGAVGLAPGSLNGESTWDNRGEVESYAAFGQVGYRFTDNLKLTVGARYTSDDISGNLDAVAVALGDKFSPADPTPLTPLTGEPDGMGGVVPYPLGGGFSTSYGDDWTETTLQAILEYDVNDDVILYANVSQGYKSGGFQDTPPNTLGATLSYEPEKVLSYEVGIKSEFMDSRLRINGAAFLMDYEDLQVEFTNDVCLCNIVSNASDAEIKGLELEVQFVPTDFLYTWLSGSYVDTEYQDYVISTGDFSGNRMQRTPEAQISAGAELTTSVGGWEDALSVRVVYTWQDDMPWAHTNVGMEDSYGIWDARVALAPLDQPWSISLWGKNIGDKDYRANIIEFLGGEMSLYAPPRTYGVDFTFQF